MGKGSTIYIGVLCSQRYSWNLHTCHAWQSKQLLLLAHVEAWLQVTGDWPRNTDVRTLLQVEETVWGYVVQLPCNTGVLISQVSSLFPMFFLDRMQCYKMMADWSHSMFLSFVSGDLLSGIRPSSSSTASEMLLYTADLYYFASSEDPFLEFSLLWLLGYFH